MELVGSIRSPPVRGDDLVVAQNHKTVHLVASLLEFPEQLSYSLGTYALCFRRTSLKSVIVGKYSPESHNKG